MKNASGVIWIKLASLYFVLGICLGIFMAASHDFNLRPVHAHINLLGWVSLALIGLIYCQFPKLANTTLARVQFWLHNIGLPAQMLLLAVYVLGNQAAEPLLAVASIVVGLSIVLFAINLFKNLKE